MHICLHSIYYHNFVCEYACTCTPCHEFVPIHISLFSIFYVYINTFSAVRNYLLIVLDIFSQYKQLPPWPVTLPAYHLCTHALFSAPSDTAHTTLPTATSHPLPTLPSVFSDCMQPSPHTTAKTLLPLSTASSDAIFLSRREREGRVESKGRSCLFADGWIWGTLICLSQHFGICVAWSNIFPRHPLTAL